MMYSGNQAKEIARLNKLLIDVERERLEIQGRAATIEASHISLQEANTRLERELAEAKEVRDGYLEYAGELEIKTTGLRGMLDEEGARVSSIEREWIKRHGFPDAPCPFCSYNGPRYYQPDTHECVSISTPAATTDEPTT